MNKRIIITGHSSGIGEALAKQYLALNIPIVGISRRSNPNLQTEKLTEISLDISNLSILTHWLESKDCQRFCQDIDELWLFNCAGTQNPANILGEQGITAIAEAVNLNVSAVLMLSDACYRYIDPKNTQLNIIHISSGAGQKTYAGWSVYGACKAALDHHARNVAVENNPSLRIVSLAPGVVDTPMQKEIRDNKAFPVLDRFLDLYTQSKLQSPLTTAEAIISYCQSEQFALEPVIDIRQL